MYGSWTTSARMYRWREGDAQWSLLEAGLPSGYIAAQFFVLEDGSGPHLCFAGSSRVNQQQTYWVARWSGATWEFPWPGILSSLGYPDTFGDVGQGMFIYGRTRIGNQIVPGRWVTDQWVAFGMPMDGSVDQTVVLDDGSGAALYALGSFTQIGGIAAPGFARYRNGRWEGLGDGATWGMPEVVFDDGTGPALYSDSAYVPGGGIRGLVRFDGVEWVAVGQMNPPGAIYDLAPPLVFDDGRGPAIYLYGGFSNMGGVEARGIARYDGHWSTLGDGLRGGSVLNVCPLASPRGPTLHLVGGGFTLAGGGAVHGTARWVGCPNCYANCDQSTHAPVLNVNDFVCFMTKFCAGAPEANCTNDATIDVSDFVCFLERYAGGVLRAGFAGFAAQSLRSSGAERLGV